MKGQRAVSGFLCAAALLTSHVNACADGNTIQDAYSFYVSRQKEAYTGAGWNPDKFLSEAWTDESGQYRMEKRSGDYQKETYEDILAADIAHLQIMGYGLDLRDDASDNASAGILGGAVPGYTGDNVNAANRFVQTVLEQTGEKEDPPYSNRIRYNSELGYGDIPWAVTFLFWCAKEAGLPEEILGPQKAMAKDLFDNLTGIGYEQFPVDAVIQLSGSGRRAVPGDFFFWKDFTHAGVVTETGEDYLVITQGDTGPGLVTSVSYSGADRSLAGGVLVHVRYPDSVYTRDTLSAVVRVLTADGFNSAAIAGIVGNLEIESGLIPYRCEGDLDRDSSYFRSWAYTRKVDRGFLGMERVPYVEGELEGSVISEEARKAVVSRTGFTDGGLFAPFLYEGAPYAPRGYGLAQFTSPEVKELLYDTAGKMGRSVGDPEVQTLCILTGLRNKTLPPGWEASCGMTGDAETVPENRGGELTLYRLLQSVPDNETGVRIASTAFLRYYEKPRHLNPDERAAAALSRWKEIRTLCYTMTEEGERTNEK